MNNEEQKLTSIHTLENDLASAVRDNNYGKNIIKIVTDHNQQLKVRDLKGEMEKKGDKPSFNLKHLSIILGILFIIGLLIAFYFIYKVYISSDKQDTQKNDAVSTTTTENKPSIRNQNILNSEIIQSVDLSKSNRVDIIDNLNKIKDILNSNNINPGNNISINTNILLDDFFAKIRYSGEESLIRAVDVNNYVIGLYSIKDKKFENYILIKIDNFDLAFKSMLTWEKYMPIDLKDIFIANITGSESTTTTPDTGVFLDKTLKNYDIRKYTKNSDNLSIIYGFINNKYILITSGESSFIDIKDRLLKENITR